MRNIIFDECDHKYYIEIPGVTTVLSHSGFSGIPADLEEKNSPMIAQIIKNNYKTAGEKGTEIHQLTEKMDLGTITPAEAKKHRYYSYLEAWARFRKAYNFKPYEIELKIYRNDSGLMYCGKLDRVGTIEFSGREYNVLLDIKTCKVGEEGIKRQLAAYCIAYNVDVLATKKATKTIAVFLNKDGTYLIKNYNNIMTNYNSFIECLNKYYNDFNLK